MLEAQLPHLNKELPQQLQHKSIEYRKFADRFVLRDPPSKRNYTANIPLSLTAPQQQ